MAKRNRKDAPEVSEACAYKSAILYQAREVREERRIPQEIRTRQARLGHRMEYDEKTVDRWFVKAVAIAGAFTAKMHPISNAGIPDRVLHYKGRTYYVEMKTTGKRCSDIQIVMHQELHKRGIEVFVLDTIIKDIHGLWDFAYTTYPGPYYKRNPFAQVDNEQ